MSDSQGPDKEVSPPPEWLVDLLKWVANDPWGFITKLFLLLSPLFMISAFLAYKLSQSIDSREKHKKQTTKRQKNIKNIRKKRTKAD